LAGTKFLEKEKREEDYKTKKKKDFYEKSCKRKFTRKLKIK